MTNMADAFRRAQPTCRHGVPVRNHCAECNPRRQAAEQSESLVGRLERVGAISLAPDDLNLPPLGQHVARVCKARGKWAVTCDCGVFRVRSGDRVHIEESWGRHRGVTS